MTKWGVELDEVVVAAAVAADEGRDKAQDGWVVQPQDRAASASARHVDIVSRMSPDSLAPKNSAPNVARG